MKGPYNVGKGSFFAADNPAAPYQVSFYVVLRKQGDHAILARVAERFTLHGPEPTNRVVGSPFRRIIRDSARHGAYISVKGGATAVLFRPDLDTVPSSEESDPDDIE